MSIRRMLAVLTMSVCVLATPARADNYRKLHAMLDDARAAISDGSVDPARDIGPLIDELRRSRDKDDQSHLVDWLVDLGRADGSSPAAVKHYLNEQLTPILLAIASNQANSNFLRGDAILGLRNLGASRDALEQVAKMALADQDSYVQSRGETLENYIKSIPAQPKAASIRPTDPAAEREAIEFLSARRLGVSSDQLVRSSLEAKPDEVKALLAAGVPADGDDPEATPLNRAFLACASGQDEDDIVAVVDLLVKAGADVKRKDEMQNTPMMFAAQYCGAKVVNRLAAAGAPINPVNGTGTTPLMIALLTGHLDGAEALVANGAKLSAQQATIMDASLSDAKAKAIAKKAKGSAPAPAKKK